MSEFATNPPTEAQRVAAQRKEARFFRAVGITMAAVLGVGIMVLGWPPVLIFLVPFFGIIPLMRGYDYFTKEDGARWLEQRRSRHR